MSLSDLTRSYTTFPTPFATSGSADASRSSSSMSTPTSYAYTPRVGTTSYSYASKGASNVPGSSIAAGETALAASGTPTAAGRGARVDDGLALGLGLGLGLGALLTVLAILFVFRQRKAQRADFEQRAGVIKAKMDAAGVNPDEMRQRE
ncbi:hypothetical protein JCM10450v2_004538 [Rhodotorula kratochvilovae]